jgi:hypothetical protein
MNFTIFTMGLCPTLSENMIIFGSKRLEEIAC